MAKSKAGATRLKAVESSILAATKKLSGRISLKPGNILVRLTDSGEETCLECSDRGVSVTRPDERETPLVEVSASSKVIEAICNGKKEASRAFVAGGITVHGDLEYFEALLTDAGLLECNPDAVTRVAEKPKQKKKKKEG